MDICIIGTGHVGLVTGTCLAEIGHRVVCVDDDRKKIATLRAGRMPFYEPHLEDRVTAQRRVRLRGFPEPFRYPGGGFTAAPRVISTARQRP